MSRPFAERRTRLEKALAKARPPVHLTPFTRDRDVAADWFERFEGAGLDGVMAKAADGAYQPGKRVMLKVKHQRTVDVVLAGFRWHKNAVGEAVGSFLLGLFDVSGRLQHVGVAASFTEKRRRELVSRARPSPGERPRESSVEGMVRVGARSAGAGGEESMEPGQDPRVGAPSPRARSRSRLRPHAGHEVSPHGPLRTLQARQAARGLHLRSARRDAALRARADLWSVAVAELNRRRRSLRGAAARCRRAVAPDEFGPESQRERFLSLMRLSASRGAVGRLSREKAKILGERKPPALPDSLERGHVFRSGRQIPFQIQRLRTLRAHGSAPGARAFRTEHGPPRDRRREDSGENGCRPCPGRSETDRSSSRRLSWR